MASITNELDVRVIPPREKHPTIHARLRELKPGDTLTILNDHDPRPLRFEILADYPDQFDWVYTAQGPELWQVNIRKIK